MCVCVYTCFVGIAIAITQHQIRLSDKKCATLSSFHAAAADAAAVVFFAYFWV